MQISRGEQEYPTPAIASNDTLRYKAKLPDHTHDIIGRQFSSMRLQRHKKREIPKPATRLSDVRNADSLNTPRT